MKIILTMLFIFVFYGYGNNIISLQYMGNETCKDIAKTNKGEAIPTWRNSYTLKDASTLYFAPNSSCASDMTLQKDSKIVVTNMFNTAGEEFFEMEFFSKDSVIYGYIKKNDVKFSGINFDFYFTLVAMVVVLIIGRLIIYKVKILEDYNIPEPVVGGIIASICILIIYKTMHIEFQFDKSLQDPLMLAFFTSIGLSADFSSFKKGGRLLIIFLLAVVALLVIQNFIGVAVSMAMGTNPLIGMLGGSITMSGGHGTGAAWAAVFKEAPYSFSNATEIAMACATFGLVMGGIIGGPVARYLIKCHNLILPSTEARNANDDISGFETPQKERLITPISFIESLALISIALLLGTLAREVMKSILPILNLPTFVYCLFIGILLRNFLSSFNIFHVFDREVSVLGNVSLSLFLAFAMMNVHLWDLVALALPIVVILASQTVVMILFAIFVTFRFCGKDYDAAVLSAGHCGFGLGATPTAMVNMQTITSHYGPSHIAFIIVPLVGAFFIDIINVLIIQGFLYLPIFPTLN